MYRRHVERAVFVAILLTVGNVASASDPDTLIAEGIKLRKQNRDQEALPLFQQALDLKTTPRALGQLGTCEQALGLWVAAETHIAEALKHQDDPWIRISGEALNAALRVVQARLGWISVWGTPAGAVVRLDGDRVATLPMSSPVRAAVGQRGLTVELSGYFPESRTVEVHSNDLVREHVALRVSGVAAPSPASSRLASSEGLSDGASSPPRESRTWKTPFGVGLAVVGAGLATWGIVWIAIDGAVVGEPSMMGTPVRNTRTAGWLLAGVGAASLIGGGALFYLDRNQRSPVAFGLTPGGVRLGGAF